MSINAKHYLRTQAAANYLSLSKSTLEKLRLTGAGPRFSTLGRVVVYAVDDLDLWVTENRKTSTSQ